MNHLTVYTLILQLALVNIFRSKDLLTELKCPTKTYYNIEIIITAMPCVEASVRCNENHLIYTQIFFLVQQFHRPEN